MVGRSQVREVVHDLRQPLAVIDALVGAVQARDDLAPDVRRHLDQIKIQVRNLTALCHRMLGVSEPHRFVALDRLVADVVHDAEIAHGRPIELETTEAPVLGDEVSLRRAVWNVLDNACRAAGSGWVRATVRKAESDVRVEVGDAGAGFANAPPGASSLGLAIVDAVVHRHGGRVEVGAAGMGGTVVTIVMPLAMPPVAVPTTEPVAAVVRPQVVADVHEMEEWWPAS